ncbi:hypothetical protein L1987_42634 [Smallanthus sonchifolius]|uniref:Uncharacterized protein n=1 Tax=Smallanthus sonchifolius TaxID=185202 RepID=A0ACB9GKD6_9ASTR|nr:hypothetical protein L1987_42634 [Smallanthus sonchifolius]
MVAREGFGCPSASLHSVKIAGLRLPVQADPERSGEKRLAQPAGGVERAKNPPSKPMPIITFDSYFHFVLQEFSQRRSMHFKG